jgi:glycosyltransferase involved in cell wall biosynthesis
MGRYAVGLIRAIRAFYPEIECVSLRQGRLLGNPVPVGVRKDLRTAIWELAVLPIAAQRARVDVLHCLYWACPLLCTVPTVVTIPDTVPLLSLPGFEGYRRGLKSKVYYPLLSAVSRRSDAVIAFSTAAACDTARILGIPCNRFVITPIPPEDRFRPLAQPSLLKQVTRKLRIDRPFVLSIASGFDYRRNISTLVRAFGSFRRQLGDEYMLVVAGDLRALERPHCPDPRDSLAEAGLVDGVDVRFTGYIDDEDLPALYSAAILHACPSLYEGFGLTGLESMACGTPVVASDIPTFREVLGDAAILVDAHDHEALGRAMVELVQDAELAHELSKRGLDRVRELSWAKAARATVAAYERVLGRT